VTARTHRARLAPARSPGLTPRPEPGTRGLPVQAIVHVRLGHATPREVFERHLRTDPAVLLAWQVAGDVDYELRLACRDIAHLDAVLTDLRHCGGAEGTSTGLVLREVPGLGEPEPGDCRESAFADRRIP
jgi:DNA-binding Lrp family transcriptional regulator